MKLSSMKELIKLSFQEVIHRKMRSFLTLIGIVIGIAAIVSLIMLGQGLQNAISEQFEALGDDKLFITAKGSTLTAGLSIDAIKITEDDLEVVRQSSGVKRAAGMIYSTGRIEFNDNVRYFFISGMPEDPEDRALIGEANSYKIDKGRPIESGDKFKAVLGYEYTKPSLFDAEISLGDKIIIQGKELKVIGFLEKIGSPPDDSSILIPLKAYSEIFATEDELGLLIAQTNAGEDTTKVGEKIEKDLRDSRDVEEGKEDFSVQTPENLLGTFSTILDIVQLVLVGIAAISLAVGGIGIMNTMYTAVIQRTKEIGIMKSIGAQNHQILILFLVEAGFYGFTGGLIGAILGTSFALLVEHIFALVVGPAFLSVKINPLLMVGVLAFSFIVGIISGISPAYRGSKLNPVDSLRYE